MFWVTDYNNQQPRNLISISLVKQTKYQILMQNWVQNRHMFMTVYPNLIEAQVEFHPLTRRSTWKAVSRKDTFYPYMFLVIRRKEGGVCKEGVHAIQDLGCVLALSGPSKPRTPCELEFSEGPVQG